MPDELTIEGKTYYGNKFFKPIEKRKKFWAYQFVGNVSQLLFEKEHALEGLDEKGQLVFDRSKISLKEISDLNFENRTIRLVRINFIDDFLSIKNCKIYFSNCTFLRKLNLIECDLCRIDILHCKGIKDVFTESCSKTYFYFNGLKFEKLYATNCLNSIFNILNSGALNVSLVDCFLKQFKLESLSLENLYIFNVDITDLILDAVSCDNHISLQLTYSEKFYISSISSLLLNHCNLKLIEVEVSGLNVVSPPISISINNTNNISLDNVRIGKLDLIGDSLEDIRLVSCVLESLNFLDFSVGKNIKFKKCKSTRKKSDLSISDSVLKGVEVNPSFLHEFSFIDFRNSTITGIELHNYKPILPSVIKASKMDVESRIDFCRELNALMISQSNKHYSTVYRALEHEYRAKSNDPSISWIDRQVLNLNFWSNVHGTMPQKALFWMLLMIVIMFGIINADLSFQTGLEYEAGFDFLSHNYSYFIKPFTFLSDVEQSYKPFNSENMQARFHPITKGFDFIFKIFYAYLLYQFIAAFRKFNK